MAKSRYSGIKRGGASKKGGSRMMTMKQGKNKGKRMRMAVGPSGKPYPVK